MAASVSHDQEVEFEDGPVEMDPDDIELQKLIGEGTTAVVFQAIWKGRTVAVKEIRATADEIDDASLQAVQRELRVLSNVRHRNILRFVGSVSESWPLRLILEFCSGGSLFDLLHNKWSIPINWPSRIVVLRDTADAMHYLHTFDPPIIHRDLKSLNLMLRDPVTDEGTVPFVKLADFGFARVQEQRMTQGVGTKHWMAPEVLQGTLYTEKADIFSYAMVAYEVVCRHVPFETLDPTAVSRQISAGNRPKFYEDGPHGLPEPVVHLVQRCWHQDPSKRPQFDEICLMLDEMSVRLLGPSISESAEVIHL